MSDVEKINGYDVCDAVAREHLGKIETFILAASSSKAITLSNNYKGFIIGIGAGNGKAMYLVNTQSNGLCSAGEVYNGGGGYISVTTGTNQITLSTTSYGITFFIYTVSGELTLPTT